jgi:hypothetical protein
MNFNTFFLDKISRTNNVIGLNASKFNPNAYLFSNIIKIEEANSSQPLVSQTNNRDTLETETTTPAENVIQVSEKEIDQLSNIITQYISKNLQTVKSLKSAKGSSSVELNKNNVILNENELTNLIQSIVQKIVNQNQISSKDFTANSQENGDAKNVKAITRSLLNILSQINNLNLSFKSGSQKISIKIIPNEQSADSSAGNSTKILIGTNYSVLNNDDLTSNIDENKPTDKSSDAQTTNSELKNSNKTDNGLNVDDLATCCFNVEITQIFSPSDNRTLYSSNDSPTGTVTNGNNSTIKFFEEYSSISSKQNIDNLFVKPSKSTSIVYSIQETSGNLISNPDLTQKNSSAISSMPATTGSDLILKTQSLVSSMSSDNDTTNTSLLQKQPTDDSKNQIQKGISNINQTSDKSALSQYSEKIKLENISITPSMPEETIKKLFSDRIIDDSQNIDNQTKTKDAIEQLKDVAGVNQTMKKLSLLDNSNNDVSTIPKSNDINQSSSSDRLLNLKDNTLIKYNNILNATKSCVTEVTDNNVVQSKFENKDLKSQTEIASDKTNNMGQIKGQDQQKEFQKREDASIQDKNSITNEIINQDSQKKDIIQSALIVDGNRAVNQALDSETKTAREVKNSSKIGISAKDETSSNANEEKAPISDTQTKNQDDKDFQKQKFAETTKNNSIQNSTNTNDFETEKLKVFTDIKTVNETVKTISVSDIIPEFSKAIQQNEKQSLTFQLTPDNLGKVKLVVDLVQNQVNTRIVVENNQIKQFIQANVEQLKQSLSSSGIDLNSVNISLSDYEQKSNKSFSQRKKINGKLESINPTDSQQTLAKKIMGYNTYEYLA